MRRKLAIPVGAAVLAALSFAALPATAQRDAGAKIRGDAGRYSGRDWSAPSAAAPRAVYPARPSYSVTPGYTPQATATNTPVRPTPESYEAYSVQPLPFVVGDYVTVVGDSTRLMRGRQTLGYVPVGQQLRVLRIRGPWVGVATEIDGRQAGGWLWYSQVAPAGSSS